MTTQKCLQNVQAEQPPYNVLCTDPFCVKTSFSRDKHCSVRGLPVDTPVLSWDPDLNGGQACYCCCSCFTLDTPIEAKPGTFVMIQDISSGDEILAAGLDLVWKPSKVKERSGTTDTTVIPGLYYVEYVMPGEQAGRHLLVTPDHLFLMQTTKALKKVQFLIPGDALTAADGKAAIVQFVTRGDHTTAVQSLEMEGEFNPKTLAGHLLNSNGVVTADYLVQVSYELGAEANSLLRAAPDEELYEVGSDEYASMFPAPRALAFADDAGQWPRGFVPDQATEMPVPAFANGYLTREQQHELRDKGEFNPITNTTGQADMLYLFQRSQQMFPDIVCILDWRSRKPNAYAWQSGGQKFIVVSGALIRVKKLYLDGLSLIFASLQASLQEQSCVCEWDYAATSEILRDTWPDAILATLIPSGIKQVEYLFSFIEDKGGEGADPCDRPALACRVKSYWAGLSFFPIPECAGVQPHYLLVNTAYASIDNEKITVVFNTAVDPIVASDLKNYGLSPAAEITKATVSPADPSTVVLEVTGLVPASYYVLLLNNLVSAGGAPLGPDQGAVVVATH